MANEQNLIPVNTRSPEEHHALSVKGGKASAKKRQEQKTLKQLVRAFARKRVSPKVQKQMEELGMDMDEMIRLMQPVVALFQKANKGDVAAFNAIRDILGEKPVDRQEITIPTKIDIGMVSTGVAPVESEADIE